MVCLLEIKSGMKVLPCAHKYHRHCIDKWLSFKRNCPTCRQDVNVNNSISSNQITNNRRGRTNYDNFVVNGPRQSIRYSNATRSSRYQVENTSSYYNSVMAEARLRSRNRYQL